MAFRPRHIIRLISAAAVTLGLNSQAVEAADYSTSNLNTAVEMLSEQLKLTPDDGRKLLQRAALLYALKKYDEALVDLNRLSQIDDKNAMGVFLKSNIELLQQKYAEALSDVNRSIELSQENYLDKLSQRANCHYMLGDDQAAVKDFDLIIASGKATQQQKLVAVANRAEVNYRLKKYKECLADCVTAIAIDPRGCGGAAFYWRSQAANALKQPQPAAAQKAKELGYVDGGRSVVPNTGLVYANMFDSAQKCFKHRIDTRHFAFFYNEDEKAARNMASFAEAFLTRINADLLPVKWDAPVNVYMMPDRTSQEKFLRDQLGYTESCWGTVISRRNALVFYTASGAGTAGHIIFGQIANNQLSHDDSFSGLNAFFEKIYGYVEKGQSKLYWGYQNPWRLEKVANHLPFTLSQLIQLSKERKDDTQSEERLLSIFLFNKDRFKRYVQLVAANDRRGYATFLEAAFDKPLSQIEPEWQKYLLDVKKNLVTLERNPASAFFNSRAEFSSFSNAHPNLLKDPRHASNRAEPKVIEGQTNTSQVVPANVTDSANTVNSRSNAAPGVIPDGWIRSGSNPNQYEMGVDKVVTRNGSPSGYIKSVAPDFKGTGTLMQSFLADKYAGKKIKLTCFTRSQDVKDWAGAWMRIDGPTSGHLAFDNMQDRPIKGTTDWTERTLTLDCPKGATVVNLGILLVGGGQVWVDDFNLESLGESADIKPKWPSYVHAEPVNLNFDGGI